MMGNTWSTTKTFFDQSWPAKPTFTEAQLGDLKGKVFIITGGYSGVGYQLARILYAAHGTIYIAGRRASAATDAIAALRAESPASTGRLEFLSLDLADLSTIGASAADFARREPRLDVLWNNAGVMVPPAGSKTAQGFELQLGTNCLGHHLLVRALHPVLARTAADAPAGSVRVVWAGSLVVHLNAPKGGMDIANLDYHVEQDAQTKYAVSKTGNAFLGAEWAKQDAQAGIVHVTMNPGNLRSELQRHVPSLYRAFINKAILHDAKFGAYTELFAGLSPAVTPTRSGAYIFPWGRFGELPPDIAAGTRAETDGGTGLARRFFEWCDGETGRFL